MRQRTVFIACSPAYSWKEQHCFVSTKSYRIRKPPSDYLRYEFDVKIDETPYFSYEFGVKQEETPLPCAVEPFVKKGRTQRKQLRWIKFSLQDRGVISLFNKIGGAKYPEWRADAHRRALTAPEERLITERGRQILADWRGVYDLLWTDTKLKMSATSPVRWIVSVMASKWWGDRTSVREFSILPERPVMIQAAVVSFLTTHRSVEKEVATNGGVILSREQCTEISIAIALLKRDGPLSAQRLRVFGERFWGRERTDKLLSGIQCV